MGIWGAGFWQQHTLLPGYRVISKILDKSAQETLKGHIIVKVDFYALTGGLH